jgi:hypothetical protein
MVARKAFSGVFHPLAGALYSSLFIRFTRRFMHEQMLFSTRAIELQSAKRAFSHRTVCRCL